VGEEYSPPLAIKYLNPKPECVCPDMGEENLVRITGVAYKILKGEQKLTQTIDETIRTERKNKFTH